eukprot:PhM_4_TR9836/c1_g1_i1/m.18017
MTARTPLAITFIVIVVLLALESCVVTTTAATTVASYNRIVCVGDFHGDVVQMLDLLRSAGVISVQPDFYKRQLDDSDDKSTIDKNLLAKKMVNDRRAGLMMGSTAASHHWSGGNTLVVNTGDAMDVGPDDVEILRFFMRLEREAAADGGAVVFLLGNHEMLNLNGDFGGVHPWSFEKSGGHIGRKRMLSNETTLGRWLRDRKVAYEYKGLLFTHGGFSAKSVTALESAMPKRKNDDGDAKEVVGFVDVLNRDLKESFRGTGSETRVAKLLRNVDYSSNGDTNPLLIHPLAMCDEVVKANRMLRTVNAQVVGHTPHNLPHFRYCDDALFAIDFKMSKWKAGTRARFAGLEFNVNKSAVSGWEPRLVYPNSGGSGDISLEADEKGRNAASPLRMLLTLNFWIAVVVIILTLEILKYVFKRCCQHDNNSNDTAATTRIYNSNHSNETANIARYGTIV